MNTKNNKRYAEMDIKMKSAVLELMKNNEIEKITVKKICETAKVNRSTFYAHYIDVFDLIEQMDEFLSKELMSGYDSSTKLFAEGSFILFLKHIKKYNYFYRISLSQKMSFPLKRGFYTLWEWIVKPNCIENGISDEDEIMYYFVYFEAGLTLVLKRWLDNECKESEEKIEQILRNCIPKAIMKCPDTQFVQTD
ncbi:TetR/AcrR family transcriptional regulator [Ruminococcus sp.]|uniref:TetR/AcrR family transcriptional regulator n=1 Tax=Ruminococcus sp. TaxID=41978 RepID=UPI003F0505E2